MNRFICYIIKKQKRQTRIISNSVISKWILFLGGGGGVRKIKKTMKCVQQIELSDRNDVTTITESFDLFASG